MSNFSADIKHPITGKKVEAIFLDGHFEGREYGVLIESLDQVYREKDIEMWPEEEEIMAYPFFIGVITGLIIGMIIAIIVDIKCK